MSNENQRYDRKQEFLDTALELFYEKGYDKTTINDIINRMGVSKGAFYHYFQSKEDVIETIAISYVDKLLYIAQKICQRKDINAIEKLNLSISQIQQEKKMQSDTRKKMRGVFKNDENLKLQKKIQDKMKGKIIPIYQRIIDEGIESKLFQVSNSNEMSILFLGIVQTLKASIDELINSAYEEDEVNEEEVFNKLAEKLSFYEEILAKVFGTEEGAIKLKEPMMERM